MLGADGDSETLRSLLALFAKLSAAVENGTVISFLPEDDPRAVDALPEFTRALRPEMGYRWLVAVPHSWRRQFLLKGRRITVGQLVDSLEANNWTPEMAAVKFDISVDAVREALHYYERNHDSIAAEASEERRRTEPYSSHRASAPR